MSRPNRDSAQPLLARQEHLRSWTVGAVGVARLSLTRDVVADPFSIPDEHLGIVLQIAGRSTLEYADPVCELAAGRWAVLPAGRVRVHSTSSGAQLTVLQVPRKALAPPVRDFGTADAKGWSRSYSNRALARTLRVFATTPFDFDVPTAQSIATLLCRVVECAVHKQHCADLRNERAFASQYVERLNRVESYILSRLRDPQLSVDEIARHVACSKRYLHKIFAASASGNARSGAHERIGEFILRSRLEHIHYELLRQRGVHEPVIKIALAHGFNNPSHFARKYRGLFGLTPSAVRVIYRAARWQLFG